MTIQAALYHLTHYRYDRPVTLGPQVIRLRPAPHSRTRVISHSLKVSPSKHFVNHQQDPYGNWLARFVFPEPVREFRIEVDLVADMSVFNPFDFFVEEEAEDWPFDYPDALREDLAIYRRTEPVGPHLAAFLDSVPRERMRSIDFVVDLNRRVVEAVGYYAYPFPESQDVEGSNMPPVGPDYAEHVAPVYFNMRKASIYGGSNEIQRNIIAKMVLGL